MPTPVERYVTDTFARLDRMLAHLQLAAPACDAALPLEPLIETLAAHAAARVLGAAVSEIKRVFGAHAAAQVEQAAGAVRRSTARPTLVLQVAPVAPAVELRARLRGRLKLVAAELREVLAAVEQALAGYHARAVATVFAELADDMLVARLYIDQVLASWRSYVGAAEGRSDARQTVVLRATA